MTTTSPPPRTRRRSYDHRLRALVHHARDTNLFPELAIPQGTARSWLQRAPPTVVTAQPLALDLLQLQREVLRLRRGVAQLTVLVRLLLTLWRLAGVKLYDQRLPRAADKARLLRAIERARRHLPLGFILGLLRLSPARYHAWKRREVACELEDIKSCPRSTPHALAPTEAQAIGAMVRSEDYRHMSIAALARYAQRIGRVLAAPGTWLRLAREHGWLRPRKRLNPPKPKLGLRADRPNQYFHIDVTIFKLLDGTRAYLHAGIDNYSRKILSWKLARRLEPASTCEVLLAAGREAGIIASGSGVMTIIADSGAENVNGEVDALCEAGLLRRILAQVEVSFSNSMIEAFWRSLKHQWLYLHALENFTQLGRLITFYVQQHNQVIPHSAFQGQTPDEMYFGTGAHIPAQLSAAKAKARAERLAANRALSCRVCRGEGGDGGGPG